MDMSSFSLEGKIALITGASYGIGMAIAKGMAAAGATIVFNDIKQEPKQMKYMISFQNILSSLIRMREVWTDML